jgi:K+-transporting ATPase ATPase C chain
MRRQLLPAIITMVIFSVVLGLIYPLVITGVGQVAFKDKADGSIVSVNGKEVGSSQIAQPFTNAKGNPIKKYFQERPSAISYDPTYSSGSNYGPLNPSLIGNVPGVNIDTKKNPYATPDDAYCVPVQATDKAGNGKVDAKGNPIYEKNDDGTYVCNSDTVAERATSYRELNGLSKSTKVPVDAVTASGSGLDPDISVANARLQAARVAEARGLSVKQVKDLIDAHTDGRPLGIIGEKTVNVLDLNLALDALKS